jgi:hypothetical protein
VKLVAFLTMIMFFIIFIIDTDFSLSTPEKSRDDVLPLSYGQKLELKTQDGEEQHNNTESFQNQTLSSAAGVNNKMQGTLIVTKKVINEGDGNSKQPSDFTIKIHGNNPSPSLFPGNSSGTSVKLDMGMYSVTESGPSGYNSTSSMDCSGAIMSVVETVKCDITNTYVKRSADDNN